MAHFVILLSLFSVIHGFDYNQRCLLYDGNCVATCPRNMHPYHTRCDGETMSQRTCDSPLVYVIGYTCGWSRCDCNADLVLDEESGYCVQDKDCPVQAHRRKAKNPAIERRRKTRRKYHLSKKISVKEDDFIDLI